MLTASQSFRLYEIVKRYFNKDDDAQNFVSEIEAAIERRYETDKDRLATKVDIAELRGDLRAEIAGSKADLLKWMIVLFAPFYAGMIVFLVKQFV